MTEEPERKEPRRCSSCKQFLKAADLHGTCIYCRPCTAKELCDLDKDWSEEQWEEVEERWKEKAAKKAPDMAMVLQSINEATEKIEAGFSSRLTALENKLQVVLCADHFCDQRPFQELPVPVCTLSYHSNKRK